MKEEELSWFERRQIRKARREANKVKAQLEQGIFAFQAFADIEKQERE